MRKIMIISMILIFASHSEAQKTNQTDYTKTKTLHTIATAHFDTQWLWTIQNSIDEYLPATMNRNFALFEKYPDYNFSFEGAFKYQLMKEYYPADYKKVIDYIKKGRWNICGSSIDAGDVNIPSPEAIIRLILLGQDYYKKEFGKTSRDIFLPDCFGFGYALPSIEAHCGLKGFSTQKLTWGSSIGIPFEIGAWQGVDGSKIAAMLNPGSYTSKINSDFSSDPEWIKKVDKTGDYSGLYIGYRYFGVGDTGGAPDDNSVDWVSKSIHGTGPLKVINTPADLLCRQIDAAQLEKLPQYNGELLVKTHGTGCYTSQCAMKRWNRQNELLADATERASVIADWLGIQKYPHERLNQAWTRFLWHQFHDDLTGTSIAEAYNFSWNDELLSLNQFSGMLQSAVGHIASTMDTRAEGISILVYNPLAIEREDVVEATISFQNPSPATITVFDQNNQQVRSQIISRNGNSMRILILAKVAPVSIAVFDARPGSTYNSYKPVMVTENSLENDFYKVNIDKNGDVFSILDKTAQREVLASPVRLQMLNDKSVRWPAWEITYADIMSEPREYVDEVVSVSIAESGTVRSAIKIVREKAGSVFTQYIRLSAGDAGQRLEFVNNIDWKTQGTLLKVAFPVSFASNKAVYDLGLGTIERGNNHKNLYEVPAQQWACISNPEKNYTIELMNDCKYGWDKPNDNTLRLTLLHTPETGSDFAFQKTNDLGIHNFTYAISAHKGDFANAASAFQAARLNQSLTAFATEKHDGPLGKNFSFINLNTRQVAVRSVKKAENSDEIIVRFQELQGRKAENVIAELQTGLISVREVNGAEEPISAWTCNKKSFSFDLNPYSPRTFAVKLAQSQVEAKPATSAPIVLNYNVDGISFDANMKDGNLDGAGHTIPAELFPSELIINGIQFKTGPIKDGKNNLVSCDGTSIKLPKGNYNRIYLLATALNDSKATFKVGDNAFTKEIPSVSGFIGQWDNRAASSGSLPVTINGKEGKTEVKLEPAFIKNTEVAWVATHRHNSVTNKNDAYIFCNLFIIAIDLPAGAGELTLPNDKSVLIAAISVASDPSAGTTIVSQVLDEPKTNGTLEIVSANQTDAFVKTTKVIINSSEPNTIIHYTTDGSLPGEDSPVYKSPFDIDTTTVIHAFATTDNGSRISASRVFTKISYLPSRQGIQTQPGILYNEYEGKWEQMPDFKPMRPHTQGIAVTIGMPAERPEDYFGLVYDGFINIPEDGIYTFSLDSDDGSILYIDDIKAVNHDGLHGSAIKKGIVGLKTGLHAIRVEYFESGYDDKLELKVEGPGISNREIPASWLSH